MTLIHVVGGLPLFLGDDVSVSLKAILAGVSDTSLIKRPSQDILLFVMTLLHCVVFLSC